ncbi:metal-dependent phosphoesterase [Cenarchaeum symbiosum A]|uniref:Metal-dependent phosphoesterase n=1 Tax=Cenarchaeum symbiosum (strain A) TaxID=414004 RepID=A0RUI4_CENSY|nr:metal-dependent phosphoesterase [Cenarchaeum symbiosum A]
MDQINSEMHCHNSFSNFHQAAHDTPYDSSVGIAEQLDRSLHLGLDALFVTNHNTLSGYEEMVRYQADHDKYARIRILPAEEITTDEGAHVIAYGIHEEIRPGMSLEETIDEIRRQDGVSSAPHPFGLLDALREKAGRCDLVEVFNSNNIDVIANARAAEFAHERGITGVAGSDSHVISTLGRCTNVIEAEDSLDGILDALRHGRVSIRATGYASARETMEYFRYKVDNSAEYIRDYVGEFYPRSRWIFSVLLGLFNRSPESYLWVLMLRLGMLSMRRISKKVNFEGLDPGIMKRRSLPEMLRASL